MIDFTKFNSLVQIADYFSTDSVCKEVIAESRWKKGGDYDVVCPYCGHHHCRKGYRGRYVCPECKNKFSVTVGTIFENTKISLRKWFMAMYLISAHKKGVSSCQLSRDIQVTQKTAWYMLQKIRLLMHQEEVELVGDIEMDEVYIGGKEKFKHASKRVEGTTGRSLKTKTPIFGIVRRGDKKIESYIYAKVVEATNKYTMYPIIQAICTSPSKSHIYTDEYNAYTELWKLGYDHQVVHHNSGDFVEGNIYTNNMEGFWAHLKRLWAIYHKISKKYMQRYLDEEVYRWNTRRMWSSTRFRMLFDRSLCVVPYTRVTA